MTEQTSSAGQGQGLMPRMVVGLAVLFVISVLCVVYPPSKVGSAMVALVLVVSLVVTVALAAYLHGSYRLPNSRMSAEHVLKGDSAGMFWLGVAVCGLLIPLVIDAIGLHGAAVALASILGLIGGLCLRYVVLAGGAMYPFSAAGFEFRPIRRPKDPMPPVGMVPPG